MDWNEASPAEGIARRRGFSLVEVMFAVTILAMVFAGVFGAMAQGFVLVESARDRTNAAQILQTRMEQLKVMGYARISNLPDDGEFSIADLFPDKWVERYSTRQEVVDIKSGLKEVRLTVAWTDSQGTLRSRSFRAYFAENGLTDYFTRALSDE